MSEKLKVLIINGSPRVNGNTSVAVRELEHIFMQNDVEVDAVQVGALAVRGCIGCNTCFERGMAMNIRHHSFQRNYLHYHQKGKNEFCKWLSLWLNRRQCSGLMHCQ